MPFPSELIETTLYLSRRNLLALLAKLDRVRAGGASTCKLIKADTKHPKYPCSHVARVIAVEDADYYAEREAGRMHEEDAAGILPVPESGLWPR